MIEFIAAILECVADRVKAGETIESALCNVARNMRESTDYLDTSPCIGGNHGDKDTQL